MLYYAIDRFDFLLGVSQISLSTPGVHLPLFSVTRRKLSLSLPTFAFLPYNGLPIFLVMKDLIEVSLLSLDVMLVVPQRLSIS